MARATAAVAALNLPGAALAQPFAGRRALIVLTSVGVVPGTDRPTGLWWSEFSDPLDVFMKAGLRVDVVSISGGAVPVDPRSGGEAKAKRHAEGWALSRTTQSIDRVSAANYDCAFLSGGRGTMWDFPDNPALARLVGAMFDRKAPVGSVCHGPAGLIGARSADGRPIVEGRRINSFTNEEERAAGMDKVVPFLLETRLRELGGAFEHGRVFGRYAVRDGALVTGQNPASSIAAAELVLEALTSTPSHATAG